MVAGAAKTAASSEAATAAVGDGKSMVTGRREAMRVEVEAGEEAKVPSDPRGRGASEVTASQAAAACNQAAIHAPPE